MTITIRVWLCAMILFLGSAGSARADLITFGTSDIDRLDLAGTQTEGAFNYTAFGDGWELQTVFGNPPAALVTYFNDEGSTAGNSVFFSRNNGGLFSFTSVDFRTILDNTSDTIEFTGVRNGIVTGTLAVSFSTTSFQTLLSNFSDPIDTLVIQVIGEGTNAAVFDNLVLNPVAIPEPTACLVLGGLAALLAGTSRQRKRFS